MDGCYLCKGHGCDDCMDITVAWKIYRNVPSTPHIKRKVIIKPSDMRLKANRERLL